MHLVRQKRPLSFAFITVGIALIGDSILGVLLVVFVQDIVGGGAQEFGWILTARGIGGVLGGLVIARIGSRVQPKNLMAFGLPGIGVLLIIMLLIPDFSVTLITCCRHRIPSHGMVNRRSDLAACALGG